MKCPKCVELGLKSRLNGDGFGLSTDMGALRYWDEEGRHHTHDPNSHSTHYWCSNGHNISIYRKDSCECWGCEYKGEIKVYYYPESVSDGILLDPALLQILGD
jgi:hypothetical protein